MSRGVFHRIDVGAQLVARYRTSGCPFDGEDVFSGNTLFGAGEPMPKRPLSDTDKPGEVRLTADLGDGLVEGDATGIHDSQDTDLSVERNRKIEGDDLLDADYLARMELGKKIKEARKAIGMSQAELARRVGMKQQSIGSIELGQVLRTKKLPEIARVLKKPLSHFIDEIPPDTNESSLINVLTTRQMPVSSATNALVMTAYAPVSLDISGDVAAGVWMEGEAWDVERYPPIAYVPEARDRNKDHMAFHVSGSSMDLAGIADGSFIVAVKYWQARGRLTNGDTVIVERKRGATVERTCKEISVTPDGIMLIPRSSDPRHKPIMMPTDGDVEPDGTIIEVVGLVIWTGRPIGRG